MKTSLMKLREKSMISFKNLYETIVEKSNDGIAVVSGKIHEYVNPKFCEMFGYNNSEIIGNPISLIVHPKDIEYVNKINLSRQSRNDAPQKYEVLCMKKDGGEIHVEISASRIKYDGKGASLAFFRDITKRKELEKKLEELSYKDELTELYNRRGFMDHLEQNIKLSDRAKDGFFMIYADVDEFKKINDVFGHDEGDIALKRVADILNITYRNTDIKSRIGGDEFSVICLNADPEKQAVLINRLQKATEMNNDKNYEKKYEISLSTGTVYYDPLYKCDSAQMIKLADKQLYKNKKAKKSGK